MSVRRTACSTSKSSSESELDDIRKEYLSLAEQARNEIRGRPETGSHDVDV
jgi:hypothetical protein